MTERTDPTADAARPNGLEEVPLHAPGLIARLLGRKPRENAWLEIRNLLATRAIRDLEPQEIERVLDSYGIASDEAAPQFRKLYAMVMRQAVRDGEITDEEIEELSHLRHVFGFSDADVEDIEREMLEDAYRTHTRLAVGDARLTDEEKDRLHHLAARLRIPNALAQSIREEEMSRVWERVFNATIVDRRLSEEEERYLQDLAANLGVKVRLDGSTLRQLDRFRLLWRIEQGEMPTVSIEAPLEADEHAHVELPAERHESVSAGSAAGRKRVRLGKAVYWKLDEEALGADRRPLWTPAARGTLTVTNRRVLFAGDAEPYQLRVEHMIRFTVFRDGIQLEMDDGHDHLFTIDGDAEIAGTVLGVFVKAARG